MGRDTELARLRCFLDAADATRCLVLDGEPGIGKTALWEAVLDLAKQAGFVVLAARASHAEVSLSFAVLADLLDGIDAATLSALPGPQRHALEVALRQADTATEATDAFGVASAFRTVVRELAVQAPVLIAVDDVQWIDDSSAIPLAYTARRLGDTRALIVLSKRADVLVPIEREVKANELARVTVGPLSFGATSRMLTDRMGPAMPRRLVRTIHDTSRGNPLFALELARLLAASRARGEESDVPIPALAEEAFDQRISGLSTAVRRVLLAVSLSGGLSRTELAGLAGQHAVDMSLAADVIVLDRFGARPTHPLLAVAAQHSATAESLRLLHADLADVVQDPILRARHLAMATPDPDPAVAREVAAAAARAVHAGAAHDGEQLATHALRLTPLDDPAWPDRLMVLARYRLLAGYREEAATLLLGHLADLPPGRDRALAHQLLAELGDNAADDAHLDAAIAEAPTDDEITAAVLVLRASSQLISRVEHIGRAVSWAEQAWTSTRDADAESRARAATAYAWSLVLSGRSVDDLADEGPEPAESMSMHEVVDRPKAVGYAFRGELARAEDVLDRMDERARNRGDVSLRLAGTIQRAEFGLRAGRATDVAAILVELAESEPMIALYLVRLRAMLAAVEGRPDVATQHANDVLEHIRSMPNQAWNRLEATRALGVAALFSRDLTAAAEHLQSIWDHTVTEGVDDPGAFPVAADLVEALVGTDRRPAALAVTERLEALSRSQSHPWGLATSRRCRAMIELADEYTDAAADQLAAAAHSYAQLGLGFDHARTLLFLGSMQRRARKRALARATLTDAFEAFERLGCTGWAASTQAELGRISGRPPAPERHLTESERAVADLAVDGLSNKEIATRLFVGVSTVEAHLSSAYRKLGVRSRTQLTHALDR